jgi:hypothetical protein
VRRSIAAPLTNPFPAYVVACITGKGLRYAIDDVIGLVGGIKKILVAVIH